jgi:hypothetical protein
MFYKVNVNEYIYGGLVGICKCLLKIQVNLRHLRNLYFLKYTDQIYYKIPIMLKYSLYTLCFIKLILV